MVQSHTRGVTNISLTLSICIQKVIHMHSFLLNNIFVSLKCIQCHGRFHIKHCYWTLVTTCRHSKTLLEFPEAIALYLLDLRLRELKQKILWYLCMKSLIINTLAYFTVPMYGESLEIKTNGSRYALCFLYTEVYLFLRGAR